MSARLAMKIRASGFEKILHVVVLNFLPIYSGIVCACFAITGCSGQPDVAPGDASVGGRTGAGGSTGLGGNDATGATSSIACPSNPPTNGSNCSGSVGANCIYQDCSSNGAGVGNAICSANTWAVATSACATVSCGVSSGDYKPQTCSAGQICVVHPAGNTWYQCVQNACSGNAVTCDCICGTATCSISGVTVTCPSNCTTPGGCA